MELTSKQFLTIFNMGSFISPVITDLGCFSIWELETFAFKCNGNKNWVLQPVHSLHEQIPFLLYLVTAMMCILFLLSQTGNSGLCGYKPLRRC